DRTAKPEKPHKQHEIRNILKTYPDLNFILIGDSGEHDADIYIEIAEEYPERILAIYLRSVNHEKRVFRVRGLIEKFEITPALLVRDSITAELHARELGLIQ
ncbi:MAG: App1 family protein, partial [Leeuwenhoekiella sp.]